MKALFLSILLFASLNLMADNQENIKKLEASDEAGGDQALQTLLVSSGNGDIQALAKQIENPAASDKAIFLLSAINSPEADKALHNALPTADSKSKAGILNALAAHGYKDATAEAEKLTGSAEPEKSAALNYLAKTATDESCRILLKTVEKDKNQASADACLAAAERNPTQAVTIYTAIYKSELPTHIKLAALLGLARAETSNRSKWLNEGLVSSYADWRGAVAKEAAELPDNELNALLSKAPDTNDSKCALITALMRNKRSTAIGYVYNIAKNAKDVETRMSAVSALGKLGRSESDFNNLIALLGDSSDEISKAAKLSLVSIKTKPADTAILDSFCKTKEGSPEQKALLEILSSRSVKGAPAIIAATLKSSADPALRTIALLALREQAEPQQLADIFATLNSVKTDEEGQAAQKAIFTLSKKYPEQSTQVITSIYNKCNKENRILLLQAIGISGNDKGLELIENALKDADGEVRDNALRTLSTWKSTSALDLLAAQCKDFPDEKMRILAQRSYISLCDMISEPYKKLTALNKITTLPLRDQEKELLAKAIAPVASAKKMPEFKIQRIGNFREEACGVADFNGDGKLDIVATPYIYYAPDWKAVKYRELSGNVDENGKGYFDNFCDLILDVNKDGKPDVLCGCWFSQQNQWYENPGSGDALWAEHIIEKLGNHETGTLEDIDGDGKALEFLPQTHITCWYERGTLADGKPGMIKHIVSENRNVLGAGAGDLNGDGRPDILRPDVWFEAPEDIRKGEWKAHPLELGKVDGKITHTSNIIVFDVNKDGLNDIIATTAHKHGIFWYQQVRDANNAISWKEHLIDNSWSQAHYLAFADIDNDGNKELITGKRYKAHNGGDPDSDGNVCIRCYSFVPGADPTFSRHTITEGEGISAGLNIVTVDMDGDGDLDLVTTGKFGGPVLLVNQLK